MQQCLKNAMLQFYDFKKNLKSKYKIDHQLLLF